MREKNSLWMETSPRKLEVSYLDNLSDFGQLSEFNTCDFFSLELSKTNNLSYCVTRVLNPFGVRDGRL